MELLCAVARKNQTLLLMKFFTHNLKPPDALSVFPQVADTVLLSIVNSLAVIYIYNQFASLRKAGSKYLLGKLMVDKKLRFLVRL